MIFLEILKNSELCLGFKVPIQELSSIQKGAIFVFEIIRIAKYFTDGSVIKGIMLNEEMETTPPIHPAPSLTNFPPVLHPLP